MSSMTGNSTCGKNSQVHMPGQDQCQRNLSCKWEGVTRKLAVWTLVVGAVALMLVLSLFCSFPIATTISATTYATMSAQTPDKDHHHQLVELWIWTKNWVEVHLTAKHFERIQFYKRIWDENENWCILYIALGLLKLQPDWQGCKGNLWTIRYFLLLFPFLFFAVFQYEDCNEGRRQFYPA